MTVVVDTNVILIANGQHAGVSDQCVVSCVRRLSEIVNGERIAIDEGFRILTEYQNKTMPRVGKRPGDVFVKWLLRHNANPDRCDQVELVEHTDRGFESFPEDDRLITFDPADRKFVAVAAAHGQFPAIAQAADSKWLGWAPALEDHGITLQLLCKTDIRAFESAKKRRKAK